MPLWKKGLLGVVAIAVVGLLAFQFLPSDTPSAKESRPEVISQSNAQPETATVEPSKSEESAIEEESAPIQANQKVFKEGEHYRTLDKPVQTDVEKTQVEVADVFWYGCPHCYNLEPIVSAWKKTLAPDVIVVRRPGFFTSNIWQSHAQLYYTIRNMGIEDKVHQGIFNEIHNNKNYLADPETMANFLSDQYGVDKQEFLDQFNSFGVSHQLQKSFAQLKGYELTGVPALIIDGRYVIEAGMASSLGEMTEIADFLVQKAKKERAAKAG